MKKPSLGTVITVILSTVLIYGFILYVDSVTENMAEYQYVEDYQKAIENYAEEEYDCVMHPEEAYIIGWEISEELGKDLTEDDVRAWLIDHPDRLEHLR